MEPCLLITYYLPLKTLKLIHMKHALWVVSITLLALIFLICSLIY